MQNLKKLFYEFRNFTFNDNKNEQSLKSIVTPIGNLAN